VQAEAQARLALRRADRGAGARHVDHEARAGHDAALVRLDDSPRGPLVRPEVIRVDDQVAIDRGAAVRTTCAMNGFRAGPDV
jgi:hypothetical protein